MRGWLIALCILGAVAIGVSVPRVADAMPCAEHFFASYPRAPSVIPKTRRVAANTSKARPVSRETASTPRGGAGGRTLAAVARPCVTGCVESLELEWFSFDLLLGEPRRIALPDLRPWRPFLGWLEAESLFLTGPSEGVIPRSTSLRTRILPKIPDGADNSGHIG